MIGERLVLLGIEHLEQRRFGRAMPADAELVDLVEQEDGVLHLRLLQGVEDAPGQRADVGAAMAANLGFVAHAAERDAHERPARRIGDRLPERRLADAGGPDEAQGSLPLALPVSLSTAMCSRMRFFTSSRPK